MTGTLSIRQSLGNMLGKMFQGNRDMYNVYGYSKNVQYQDCVARYQRQDVAARIVDVPADSLWANPPIITTGNAEWDSAWSELVTAQNLWNKISRVDKLAGMGQYAVLLVGYDKTPLLDMPVTNVAGRKVAYLQPYSVDAAKTSTYVTDPNSPRFMKPAIYQISPVVDASLLGSSGTTTGVATAFQVHYSRILHIAEGCLVDELIGNPRMFRVFNLLDDLMKVCGGSAETFWIVSNRGMQVDIDKEMELTEDDEAALSDEIEEYTHNLRRVIRTRGVNINSLGSDSPDPMNIFQVIMSLIAGATGLPKRILMGSEAGHLASGQDRNNWAERIEERRTTFGEPIVLWPLIRQLTAAGVLPTVPEENIVIEWPDAFKLSPLEIAQTAAQRANAAANITRAWATAPDLVTPEVARKVLDF